MSLSEAEQRLLDELEASLKAEDPSLASKFAQQRPKAAHPRHLTLAVIGIICGIALLVVGMWWVWPVSVVGFMIMLASVASLFGSRPTGHETPVFRPSAPSSAAGQPESSLMDRFEQRWQRRHEGE